jgi:hypothetical protein
MLVYHKFQSKMAVRVAITSLMMCYSVTNWAADITHEKNGRVVSKAVATTAQLRGSVQGDKLILNNKIYPIVFRTAGSIDGVRLSKLGYNVTGWAADLKANKSVQAIIAVEGSTVIGMTLPTVDRDDIVNGLGTGLRLSGFSMNLAVKGHDIHNSQVRLFALMADGVASPLASYFEESTHGLFKNVAFVWPKKLR